MARGPRLTPFRTLDKGELWAWLLTSDLRLSLSTLNFQLSTSPSPASGNAILTGRNLAGHHLSPNPLSLVPINAADPVAAARAFAAREVGLAEIAATHVTPPDWRREENPQAPLDSHHHVTLHTPWQSHLA